MADNNQSNQSHNELENAPAHIQLAIDLIMLLEQHELPKQTVLKALEIVQRDFENKPD